MGTRKDTGGLWLWPWTCGKGEVEMGRWNCMEDVCGWEGDGTFPCEAHTTGPANRDSGMKPSMTGKNATQSENLTVAFLSLRSIARRLPEPWGSGIGMSIANGATRE